jgi:hypothetical protein
MNFWLILLKRARKGQEPSIGICLEAKRKFVPVNAAQRNVFRLVLRLRMLVFTVICFKGLSHAKRRPNRFVRPPLMSIVKHALGQREFLRLSAVPPRSFKVCQLQTE